MSRALVTGASRGIGAAIAKALARAGHKVIINYRTQREQAEAVLAEIEGAGGRAVLAPFDVRDRAQVSESIEALLQEPDPIDVLVNNAGIAKDNPFPSISWEDWEQVTRTSLDGFYNVTRPLVMPMVRRKYGRIITLSSVSGVIGNRGQTNYAAAKAGLIGATKSLSKELAKRRITVNAVAPGLIDTEMTKGAPVEQIVKLIPAARLGRAEEVADLVAFLASERAAYITGQVIGINGGLA
jgi:3-oxoacyl-[acyl-carrier protein] reductase